MTNKPLLAHNDADNTAGILKNTIMKTIKIKSDFGIVESTVRKSFFILGFKFAVVKMPCKYMNAKEPLVIDSVVEVSTGVGVGMFFSHKQTVKSMVTQTIEKITGIAKNEIELKSHVSKFETINI